MLDQAVGTSYEDQKHTRAQHNEWNISLAAANDLLRAIAKEETGKHHAGDDDYELDSKRDFGQFASQSLNAPCRRWIKGKGDS
jgi:hypothetical protein